MLIINKEKFRKETFEEGFRSEKTSEMIGKLMSVIAKKAGLFGVKVSPVPDFYSNKYGKFIGFFVSYNGGSVLRFNFLSKGQSDQFYSIDMYDLQSMKPTKTIDLLGFNVVEVVDFVADVLSGDFYQYAEGFTKDGKRFQEAVTYKDSVNAWISTDPAIKQQLINITRSSNRAQVKTGLNQIRPQFENYLVQNRLKNSKNPEPAFIYSIKKILEEEGVDSRNVAAVEVIPGSPENLNSRGTAEERAYNELMENEHIFKFKALRLYCNEIKAGNPAFKSIYIYGDGGVGKSYWVKKILAPLPNATMLTAKISGYTGLIKTLFENREDTILIFDDTITEADMKNQTIAGILKVILDPDPPREIQVIRGGRSGSREESYYDRGKFYLNEEDYREFDKYNRSKLQENLMDVIDMTTTIATPERFNYDSITVFITNYKEVPQPVQDRCWILRMEFTNQQILDLIEESLAMVAPEASSEILDEAYKIVEKDVASREVIELLRGMEAKKLIPRKLSYRVFNRLVALKQLGVKEQVFLRALIRMELGN